MAKSRFEIRIPASAYVLAVLLLTLGALVAASANLDPKTVTRAQITPEFLTYGDPDGPITFNYPPIYLIDDRPLGIPVQ
ncbi:MAG TPA: hypothetical protein VMT34_03145, partial [Aggregatilineales bacterium]|nr:hypothetical protein [Aggregatilineales bacterium]